MAKSHSNTGGGPSQRQLRVGELIRRRLSEVLQRGEVHDPELQSVPITVGEVRVSPDLRLATAFVLPLGGQGAEEILAAMRRNRYELRRAVHKELALKYSPELRFEIDTTFDQMDNTRRMLAEERVTRDVDAPDGPDGDTSGWDDAD
ncbi:30S ribosome-binding factor RbfA [Alphaproteobacteria bacterium KMM 3653]|uniref:Ribosome-binding factor A n=1 Tax=Harenicola maris TaxID=2841044 RepID=A0AAP2CUJ4_9RHOB|nr:30S ribosome-binding factor RbfA [Harenicola maris]